jgi:hypothetical protein
MTLIEKARVRALASGSTAAKIWAGALEHLDWQLPAQGVVAAGELFGRVDEDGAARVECESGERETQRETVRDGER